MKNRNKKKRVGRFNKAVRMGSVCYRAIYTGKPCKIDCFICKSLRPPAY